MSHIAIGRPTDRVGVQATRNPRAQDVLLHTFDVEPTTSRRLLLGALGWIVIVGAVVAFLLRQYWAIIPGALLVVVYVALVLRRAEKPQREPKHRADD